MKALQGRVTSTIELEQGESYEIDAVPIDIDVTIQAASHSNPAAARGYTTARDPPEPGPRASPPELIGQVRVKPGCKLTLIGLRIQGPPETSG